MIGPYGIKYLGDQLMLRCEKYVHDMLKIVTENKALLIELRAKENMYSTSQVMMVTMYSTSQVMMVTMVTMVTMYSTSQVMMVTMYSTSQVMMVTAQFHGSVLHTDLTQNSAK